MFAFFKQHKNATRMIFVCKLSLLLLAAGVLSSCRQESEDETAAEQTIQTVQIGEGAFPSLLAGPCRDGLNELGLFNVYLWNGFRLQPETKNLDSWTSVGGLQDDLVDSFIYGYKETTIVGDQCEDRDNPREWTDSFCRDERQLNQRGQELSICSNNIDMSRVGIESAAITVASVVEEAYTFFQQATDGRILDSLTVYLFPDFAYRSSFLIDGNYVEFSITDNAAWGRRGSSTSSENLLYVFPMSVNYLNARPPEKAAQFWQVPWIMSHEFGHHIFYNFLRPESRRYFGFDFLQAENEHWIFHKEKSFNLNSTANEDQYLTSINEGFSDLFAHYFGGESSFDLVQLGCVFTHRDVLNPFFNNGQPKRFNRDDEFNEPSNSCAFTDINGVHTQGSVFAHFADQYWNQILPPRNAGEDLSLPKARLTLQALNELSLALESSLTAEEDFNIWELSAAAVVRAGQRWVEENSGPSQFRYPCGLLDATFSDYWTFPLTMAAAINPECQDVVAR